MFSEKTIEVSVKDHTGDISARVHLAVDRTIAQVRPQILEPLSLHLEAGAGQPVTYVLANDSLPEKPYLSDNQYVGEVLADGQVVRVLPEIVAGAALCQVS